MILVSFPSCSENWILTASLLDRLEAFQGEIGQRILNLSKFHSTLSTRLALRWPSIAARVYTHSSQDQLRGELYWRSDLLSACSYILYGLYRSLEGKLDCQGATDNVLNSKIGQKIKKSILNVTCLSEATQHNSTAVAAIICHSAS